MNILLSLGTILSFYEMLALVGKSMPQYHEWFYRSSQLASWVKCHSQDLLFLLSFGPDASSSCFIAIDEHYARVKVLMLVSSIMQSIFLLLVDCETYHGDSSFIHRLFFIEGIT